MSKWWIIDEKMMIMKHGFLKIGTKMDIPPYLVYKKKNSTLKVSKYVSCLHLTAVVCNHYTVVSVYPLSYSDIPWGPRTTRPYWPPGTLKECLREMLTNGYSTFTPQMANLKNYWLNITHNLIHGSQYVINNTIVSTKVLVVGYKTIIFLEISTIC